MRVAIVYAGRWYGELTPRAWIDNHMKHLIRPNNASVFVVADLDNWCHAPLSVRAELGNDTSKSAYRKISPDAKNATSAAFLRASDLFAESVAKTFRHWNDVHAQLLPVEVSMDVDEYVEKHEYPAAFKYIKSLRPGNVLRHELAIHMRRWYYQYTHVARALGFWRNTSAGALHDVVVRARIDAMLESALYLSHPRYRNDNRIHAAAYFLVNVNGYVTRPCNRTDPRVLRGSTNELGNCAEKFRDLLQVGTPTSMATLEAMSSRNLMWRGLKDIDLMRCSGWCEEEQTMLQILHDNISLAPLPAIRIDLQRINKNTANDLTPALHNMHGGCIAHNAVNNGRHAKVANADPDGKRE